MIALFCAGNKTASIANAAKGLFSAGAVEVKHAPHLKDVIKKLKGGEPYERVVIMQRGFCDKNDDAKVNERELKTLLQKYADAVTKRKGVMPTTVFVCLSNDIADVIKDEVGYLLGGEYKIIVREDYSIDAGDIRRFFGERLDEIASNYTDTRTYEAEDDGEDSDDDEERELKLSLNEDTAGLNRDYGEDKDGETKEHENNGESEEEPAKTGVDDSFFDERLYEAYDFSNPKGEKTEPPLEAEEVEKTVVEEIKEEPLNPFEYNAEEHNNFGLDDKKSDTTPPKKGKSPKKPAKVKKEKVADKDNAEEFENSDFDEFSDELYNKNIRLNTTEKLTPPMFESLKKKLDRLSGGKVLLFCGTDGAGASVCAYNTASTVAGLGYGVLLVDLDTKNRSQSYLNKHIYAQVHANPDYSFLKAINDPVNITDYVSVAGAGLHVITCPLTENSLELTEKIQKDRQLLRFVNVIKQSYDYVVFDAPKELVTHFSSELAYNSDYFLFVTEATTRSLVKTLLFYGNIADGDGDSRELDELAETIFSKSKFIINKVDGAKISAFGVEIKASEIGRVMSEIDVTAKAITGVENELKFANIPIVAAIPYIPAVNSFWLSDTAFSDKLGADIFLNVIANIF